MYQRVIPRDLFNEAKLLKCMGQLSLLIHDGKAEGLFMDHDTDEFPGFDICQDQSDGSLWVSNLRLSVGISEAGEEIATDVFVKCIYNSKEPYPLLFIDDKGADLPALAEDGSIHELFAEHIASLR